MEIRQIIFRGKTKDGRWVYGFVINSEHTIIGYFKNSIEFQIVEVIPETVGQYTGVTDKNGNKIFEGDILKVKSMWKAKWEENEYGFPCKPIKCDTYWSVEYKQFRGEMGFMVYGIDRRWHTQLTWNKIYNSDAEVIGNIHDNPELLEEQL